MSLLWKAFWANQERWAWFIPPPGPEAETEDGPLDDDDGVPAGSLVLDEPVVGLQPELVDDDSVDEDEGYQSLQVAEVDLVPVLPVDEDEFVDDEESYTPFQIPEQDLVFAAAPEDEQALDDEEGTVAPPSVEGDLVPCAAADEDDVGELDDESRTHVAQADPVGAVAAGADGGNLNRRRGRR